MLQTTPTHSLEDVRQFFDRFSEENFERHGRAGRLLKYRTRLLLRYASPQPDDTLLDLGCGNGNHLFALDGRFKEGIGVDLSAGMIASAQRAMPATLCSHYRFSTDDAHTLSSQPDASVDVVICVGALEHMPDKLAVLQSARRVLRNGGRFVCLTLNDEFLWYRRIAPALGYATHHLATDERLDWHRASLLLDLAGFRRFGVSHWAFVPGGDMPAGVARFCRALECIGRFIVPRHLRGGLILHAKK